MTAPEDAGLLALAERIARRSGVDVGAYKDRCIRRRIAARMRARGVHGYDEYVALLDAEPEELERLLDALTINVTKFFRNPETWAWLAEHLLPSLLTARGGALRVWSAGCASGEEPYTIVMLVAMVLERLGHAEWLERLQVDATDIDRNSLERARAGRYDSRAFSEADPAIVPKFCRSLPDGTLEVRPELRARVHVGRFDLTGPAAPAATYDLICCRNVVIYFDRPTQERLMDRFADALRPDGLLLLGKVESILGRPRSRFQMVEPRERVYRKAA